jgi:hypothetical protein
MSDRHPDDRRTAAACRFADRLKPRAGGQARRGFVCCGLSGGYAIIMATCGLISCEWFGRYLSMWTVIYIAPTAKISETIRQRLTEEGFLVQVRPVNLSRQQYEILVPSAELDEVQEVLNEILNA